MILNKSQAEAVYSAMCALNNVAGRLDCTVQEITNVRESVIGTVYVKSGKLLESHTDQNAFAAAYGLLSDEPQSAVAAAAGGLAQTAVEY